MTQKGHTFQINPRSTRRQPNKMVALKRIQNYCYFLTDQIGLGFTSHVYKGKSQLTNTQVAIKVIDRKNNQDQLQKQFLQEEVAVLEKIKQADTTNLLKLECVILTKNNMYIITEFCEGKDLAKILRKKRKMNETQAQSILKQLLNGYRQLYKLGIVHRDLKLANLFITQGRIKIADFGFAISQSSCHQKMDYNVGSPYYMPPQALKDNQYSFKSDIWAIGVIAYQLIYGRVPWKDKQQKVIYEMMKNCPIQKLFDDDIKLSDHYKEFIKKCLTVDLGQRANPEYIINYEWPLANRYVDGLETLQRGQSIGKALTKTQFFVKPNRNDSLDRRSPVNKKPQSLEKGFNRNRSKSVDRHIPIKNTTETIIRQNSNSTQQIRVQSSSAQYAMVGQLHYCRFMYQLYQILQRSGQFEGRQYLQDELKTRIIQKISLLKSITESKQNVFKSPGFSAYINSSSFNNLSRVIIRHFNKYFQKFGNYQLKWVQNNQNIVKIILQLRKYPKQLQLLEQIVYYLQIKQLQSHQNHHNFYQKSRINYLVDENHFQQPIYSKQDQIRQRLMKKLTYLAIA